MADTRQDLDNNIAAVGTIVTNLITAVQAALNSRPPEDYTAEDTQLQAVVTAAQAELNAINPPPPPGPTAPPAAS